MSTTKLENRTWTGDYRQIYKYWFENTTHRAGTWSHEYEGNFRYGRCRNMSESYNTPVHWFTQFIWKSPSIAASLGLVAGAEHSMLQDCLHLKVLTATAKSLQSCATLCDPIHGSPPGSPVPGILQARILVLRKEGKKQSKIHNLYLSE